MIRVVVPVLVFVVVAACSGAPDIPVTLTFDAKVGAQDLTCSSYDNVGLSDNTVEVLDFRFYVHDVALVSDSGESVMLTLDQETEWQHEGVALLDFEDNSGTCQNGDTKTNSVVTGTVPEGTYTGVEFLIGVPADLNDDNPATTPSPLDSSRMTLHWTWMTGYKFARWDVRVVGVDTNDDESDDIYNVHLGSTGCAFDVEGDESQGATCTLGNRPSVALDSFDHTTDTIVIDYLSLMSTSDLETNAGQPGCMSGVEDTDCPVIFDAFGLGETGTADTVPTFISAE